MHIHRSTVDVVVQAPAKLNLFFEVLGKREDGYHEIETLMVPINLYDTLYLREDPSGLVELDCRQVSRLWEPQPEGIAGTVLGDLPEGPANLVVQAIELLRRRAQVRCGAVVRLVKRIPTAAGLGGGSSDAAAALVAANQAWSLGWTRVELASVAAELGSDVPFFLGRQGAICRGRGELIEPVAGLGNLHFVLVRPPAGLSTASVYRACHAPEEPLHVKPLLRALLAGELSRAGRLLFNRLQPAARRLSPWIERLERKLAEENCLGHLMSGSGTCCFGLCRHARQARRVARHLGVNGVGAAIAVRASR